MKKTTILFAVLCFIATAIGQTTVLRVNPDATGETEDGLTWETAYKTLTNAIVATGEPGEISEIWVKAGTYSENPFWMRNNVNIYGGFTGHEENKNERNWQENKTILTPIEASKRIMIRHGGTSNKVATWDGFIFTGASGNTGSGGAVYLNRGNTLSNCIITDNHASAAGSANGGGLYMDSGSKIINCIVSNNTAKNGGGGIAVGSNNEYAPAEIINCVIVNNIANGGNGGGIMVGNYNVNIYNTLIANNTSLTGTGGVVLGTANADLTYNVINCTVVNNLGGNTGDGGLRISTKKENSSRVVNSILHGNRLAESNNTSNLYVYNTNNILVSYTAIEDSLHVGTKNREITDNQFKTPTSVVGSQVSLPEYDWTLLDSSICINRGDNTVVYGTFDLQGDARIQHGIVDLGAYESDYNKIWTGINWQGVNNFAYYNSTNNSLIFQDQVNQVQVFNIQGANILSLNHSSNQIFLPQLPQGVYLVKYRLGEEVQQQKFIVK